MYKVLTTTDEKGPNWERLNDAKLVEKEDNAWCRRGLASAAALQNDVNVLYSKMKQMTIYILRISKFEDFLVNIYSVQLGFTEFI